MSSSCIPPSSFQCIHTKQLSASSPNSLVVQTHKGNIQDKFSMEEVSWKQRCHQQVAPTKPLDRDTSLANTGLKFYVDYDDDSDQDNKEEEIEEEDGYSATWSFSSFEEEEDDLASDYEQELNFVKKKDDQDNTIYTTTAAATATVKKPISLLTQMLNTSSLPPTPSQQLEKKPLLKRCQSKYQNLSSWFGTCS